MSRKILSHFSVPENSTIICFVCTYIFLYTNIMFNAYEYQIVN